MYLKKSFDNLVLSSVTITYKHQRYIDFRFTDTPFIELTLKAFRMVKTMILS